MSLPQLVEEIFFEDGVSNITVSNNGEFIAISTIGLLGVYKIESTAEVRRLVHVASSILEDKISVKTAFFSEDNEFLTVFTSDGLKREYSVLERSNGLMRELSIKGANLAA